MRKDKNCGAAVKDLPGVISRDSPSYLFKKWLRYPPLPAHPRISRILPFKYIAVFSEQLDLLSRGSKESVELLLIFDSTVKLLNFDFVTCLFLWLLNRRDFTSVPSKHLPVQSQQ